MNNWQRNLYASWAAQMLALIGFSATLPFLPLFMQELGMKDKEEVVLVTGLMSTLSFIAMAVMAPIWGLLADRYGRKSMVFRAMFLGVFILGLMGFTDQVWQLVVLRIMQGAFTGSISASIAFVASIVPQKKMGYSLGLMQTAVFAGISVGPLVGGLVSDTFGRRYIFLVTAVMLLIASLIVWFVVHEDFVRPPKEEGASFQKALFGDLNLVSHLPGIIPMAIVLGMIQLTNQLIQPIIAIFVQQLGSLSSGIGLSTSVGIIGAATGVAGAVSSLVAGKMSDKYGNYPVLIVLAVGASLAHFPQAFVTDSVQLLILRCLGGIFLGGMQPAANSIISQFTPKERRGSAYGFVNMISSLGLSVGPISGALLSDGFSPQAAFLANGFILAGIAWWVGFGAPSRVIRQLPVIRAVATDQAVVAPQDD